MESKINYFFNEMDLTITGLQKYKYDVSKNNISLYIFENNDLINIYILPEILDFNINQEEILLKEYQDYIISINNLDLQKFYKLLHLLVEKYNLKLIDLKNNLNNSFLISHINRDELSSVINLYVHYDREKIKIK